MNSYEVWIDDMIRASTVDISKGWIFDAKRGWAPDKVQRYCVQDEEWQGVRLSMKGVPTAKKLDILLEYYVRKGGVKCDEHIQCQIDNYLGALRRGGQLDDNNLIRKYI